MHMSDEISSGVKSNFKKPVQETQVNEENRLYKLYKGNNLFINKYPTHSTVTVQYVQRSGKYIQNIFQIRKLSFTQIYI